MIARKAGGWVVFLIVLMFVLNVNQVWASEDEPDIILLKNGGTLKGKITDTIPGDKVVIERRDGVVFEVPFKKIFAVTTEDELAQRRAELALVQPKSPITEWENVTLVGLLRGEGETFFSATTFNGAWFGDHLFVGAGIGWDNYPHGYMVPIYAGLRYQGRWRFLKPFVFADVGYALGWLDGVEGGGYGGLQIGFGYGTRLMAGTSGAVPVVQIGFRLQQAKEPGGIDGRTSVSYNFVSLMAGVAF